jgi:two-component system OmpR family sensor kinase
MAPIRNLRTGIEARGSGDLTPIPAAGLPSEIGPIADAVNHLLLRLSRALDAERSFTANSAHELRTPVAAALAQTQRLIAETKDAVSRERAQQIERALQRLARLSEKLMQLARAEGGRLRGRETTDIASVATMVVDEMVRKPGMAERIILDVPATPVPAGIDADSFAIVLRNLVENGLKHGPADRPVAIALSRDGVLTVSNEGPPVPPDLVSRLLQPFERGHTTAEGAGLGLAIVKAIAAGTGGRLILTSPLPGQQSGFEARFAAPPPKLEGLAENPGEKRAANSVESAL